MTNHESEPEIEASDEQLAGVYANWTRVIYSTNEFTIDFVRLDPAAEWPRGIMVSRIAVPPNAFAIFTDQAQAAWSEYLRRAMPRELDNGV